MYSELESLMSATENPWDSSERSSGFEGFHPLEVESVPVVEERKGPRNFYDITFPQGILWGIMVSAATFGLSLVIERRRGTLLLAVLATSICFVGMMMLFSVVGRTEQSAGAIGWIAMMILAMLGGGMLPLFMMPGWLQMASSLSPVKWAILAMEGAIWRQFSPREMLLPCAILVAVGALCFAVGVKTFRWSHEA